MASSSRDKNLEDAYAELSLNKEDEEGLVLEDIPESDKVEDLERCLVGRFLTNKKVNFGAMQETLSSIWRPVKGVFMEETPQMNTFLFKFFHDRDMQRILDDGPWTFNQQALLIRKLNADEQIKDVKLSELYMWVQVYDLPVGYKSEFILKSIGNYVGQFMETDPKNFQGMSKSYMRIRVAFDVGRALKKQMKIKKPGGEWIWIHFKYERLPSFCFYCGRIGHIEKFCEDMFDNIQGHEKGMYDNSLRAPFRNQESNKVNQWIRNSDGGSLNKAGANVDKSERIVAGNKEDESNERIEKNNRYSIVNHNPSQTKPIVESKDKGGDKEMIVSTHIVKYTEYKRENKIASERENNNTTGISFGLTKKADPKRRRIEDLAENGLGQDNELLDEAMLEVQETNAQNQKNGIEAGAAVQACLEL